MIFYFLVKKYRYYLELKFCFIWGDKSIEGKVAEDKMILAILF